MSDQNKVLKFKKRKSMSIGVIVFLILFIYIAIKVGIYLGKDQLTIYEVQEGSTAVDNRAIGLILRGEEIIKSDKAGYIIGFQRDSARVAKNMPLFSISTTLANADNGTKKLKVLSDRDIAQIKHEISNYVINSDDSNFGSIYGFQDDIKSTMTEIMNNNMVRDEGQGQGDNAVQNSAIVSKNSGIVTYYKDGFEAITPDQVDLDSFNKDKYKRINLRTSEKIKANTPVCKLITSESWKLVLQLNKDQYDKLKDKKTLNITILEDGLNLTPPLELKTKDSAYYAILTMNKNMSNYLAERYLNVEIKFDSISGLKIPHSSLVDKNCYEVPTDYFVKGGDSNRYGLTKVEYDKDGEIKFPFVATEIYYETDKYAYIDADSFPAGTKIQLPGKNKQITLTKVKKLTGVFSVNQGYAVFKRVEVINNNEEYCIIKKGSKNGLSAYDHIALDSKMAVEQKIIY